jgi:enoyl-[acyl-carrier protein] reductase I
MQRTALVVGVANQRSLAWSSALALLRGEFDHVIVTYENERFQKSIQHLVSAENDNLKKMSLASKTSQPPKLISCLPCDVVGSETDLSSLFDERIPSLLHERNNNLPPELSDSHNLKLNALVHSIAFAPAESMKSADDLALLNTTREDFTVAHSISAHSLLNLSKHALPLLSCQGDGDDLERHPSITSLTYLGSTRAVRNYNVMGPAKASLEACIRGLSLEISSQPHRIRVNAVSAGPVNTLAGRGIRDFNEMRKEAEEKSFLKRSVTGTEVGNMVEFVAGSRASGVTGQVLFCDGGYSSFGG